MRAIILSLLIILFPTISMASSIGQITLSELEAKAQYVVLGQVMNIVPQGHADHVTIKVDAYLKGANSGQDQYTFKLISRGGLKDFDPELKIGEIGVFFLIEQETQDPTSIDTVKKAYWGSIALFPNSIYTLSSEVE